MNIKQIWNLETEETMAGLSNWHPQRVKLQLPAPNQLPLPHHLAATGSSSLFWLLLLTPATMQHSTTRATEDDPGSTWVCGPAAWGSREGGGESGGHLCDIHLRVHRGAPTGHLAPGCLEVWRPGIMESYTRPLSKFKPYNFVDVFSGTIKFLLHPLL